MRARMVVGHALRLVAIAVEWEREWRYMVDERWARSSTM